MILEFETRLDDDIIHLPDDVAAQLKKGATVHVAIRPVESEAPQMTPDEAWAAVLAFIEERRKLPATGKPYQWNREDAYEHLK
jgi:hypothetical protein